MEVLPAIYPDYISGHKPGLILQTGYVGICYILFNAKKGADLGNGDTAVLLHKIHNLLLFCRRLEAAPPYVHELPVNRDACKGSFTAPQELSVGNLAGLNTWNFPVPWAKTLVREPVLRGSMLLY